VHPNLSIPSKRDPYLKLLSDPRLLVSSQVVTVHWILRCIILLWFVNIFLFGMSRETNSSTSSIFRTRSKCCNSQNMSSMQLLLCSTLEYHTLLYQEVVPSIMASLMKWCSYTSLLTLSPSGSCLECWACILLWPSEIHSKSYCFEIPRTFLSFLAWLVNRSLSEVWLCCQVRNSGTHLRSES
jgi:hypothetical protein